MNRVVVVLVLSGCGRIAFDPVGDGGGAGGDAAMPSSLVAWYRLDDPIGMTFVDSVAGNNGTCTTGTCPTPVPGHIGDAFHFDGSAQCIDVADAAQLHVAQVTVALWASQDAAGAFSSVMKRVDVAPNAWDTWEIENPLSDGSVAFVTTTSAMSNHSTVAAAQIQIGRWQHFAATYDGTTARLYVDGMLAASNMLASPLFYDTHDMWIGCDDNGTTFAGHYQGALDDIQIYDRALSDTEILQLSLR